MNAGRAGTAVVVAGALSALGFELSSLHGVAAGRLSAACLGAVGLVAVLGCVFRASRDGRAAAVSWLLLAAGVGLQLVSQLYRFRTTGEGAGAAVFPSYADVTGVLAVVLLAAGLAKLPGTAESSTGWRLAWDGVGVGFATLFLTGQHAFDGLHHFGPPLYAVSAHVIAEVTVTTAALVVLGRLRHPGGPALRTLLPLCAAAVAGAAGDAWGVTAASGPAVGGPRDVAWVAAVALVALAAYSGPTMQHTTDISPLRERIAVLGFVLPMAAVVVSSAVLLLRGQSFSVLAAFSLVGLGVAVVVRHAVARLDHLMITRTVEAKVAERTLSLLTREQWFRSLVQNSSDVLTVVDAAGVVRYQSPAVTRVFGHDPALMVGTPISYLMRSADVHRLETLINEAMRSPRSTFTLEFALWHKDGRWCETESTITSLMEDQDIRGLVLNTRDISERKRLEDALTHQAFHDTLTGLANRVLFQDRVGHTLATVLSRNSVGVLFLDLDGFKGVNDTQGHAVGDQLLGLVAERLRHCIRPGDTVARLGGDEFAVLVQGDDGGRIAVWVAERICAALRQPFVLEGREVSIGVSVGIALNSAGGETSDALLRNADVAMYKAKALRGGGWIRFEPGMRDALLERIELENDLKLALGRNQLAVYYQPTVELGRGTVVGVEALLRWHHPDRGIVGPEEFIPMAEESGLITTIGEFVLRETCRQGARWQVWAQPGQYFHVAVNISARQVAPALVDTVRAALAESGLPPGALVLEITESVLVERTEEVLGLLHQLKALGVRLAIDDFGTGYSSLSYLSRFPVDILKMDRSFVEAVGETDSEQAELARTIVHLGRSLHLATVAEGIETQSQHRVLREMGCDYGQGYLFARAIPAAGLDELLSCRLVAQRTGLELAPAMAVDEASGSPGGFVPVVVRERYGEEAVAS